MTDKEIAEKCEKEAREILKGCAIDFFPVLPKMVESLAAKESRIKELEAYVLRISAVPEQEFEEVKTLILGILAQAAMAGFSVRDTDAVKAFNRRITYVNRIKVKNQQLESKIKELEAKLTEAYNTVGTMCDELTTANSKIASLEAELEKEKSKWKPTDEQLLESIREQGKEIFQLESKTAELKAELEDIKIDYELAIKTLKDMVERNKTLESKTAELRKLIGVYREALEKISDDFNKENECLCEECSARRIAEQALQAKEEK